MAWAPALAQKPSLQDSLHSIGIALRWSASLFFKKKAKTSMSLMLSPCWALAPKLM